MRFSPIIRKILKRLSARYFVTRMAQTLATVSISASAVMLLVAFPATSAEQPAQEKEAPALKQADEEESAFCAFDFDSLITLDSLNTPTTLSVADILSTFASFTDVAFKWDSVEDNKGGLTLIKSSAEDADIVYHSNASTDGRHIEYTNGTTSFGTGSGEKTYHWVWDNFGKYEAFHDGIGNKHVWDANFNNGKGENGEDLPPGRWVDSGELLHYGETFDENGLPENGIGKAEFRWTLKEGTGDRSIIFMYDDTKKQTSRWFDGNESSVSETFEGLKHAEEDSSWNKKLTEINTEQSNYGSAVANTGTLTDISASFVANETLSSIHVRPDSSTIDPIGTKSIANEAMGGAVYNSGTISNITLGGFAGNIAQSEIIMDATVYFSNASYGLNLTSSALGGAIYNSGTVSLSIAGDFVSNSAHAIHWPKGGVNYSVYATENIVLAAKGGAVFNMADIGSISGNYVGNNAISQITMAPHGSASYAVVNGAYSAAGGAIYNGMDGAIGAASENSKIGDITANFVGNYAYNYHFTQQRGAGSSTSKAYASITTYASGGAIFNGVECLDANNSSITNASSSIGNIEGIFIDNYAYDVDPFVCGEFCMYDKPDTDSSKDYKHYQLGDYFTHKRHHALGGAVYNGVSGGAVSDVSSSITSISGDFVSNYVYAKTYKTRGLDIVNNPNYDDTTLTIYASGGAIYNGLESLTVGNSSKVKSEITGGIDANFTGNYAYVYRQLGGDFDDDNPNASPHPPFGFGFIEEDYAIGGAIYNGIADISTSSAEVAQSTISGTVKGSFTDNFASVEGSSNWAHIYAMGGAVYNGIHYTSYGKEVINGNIQSTIAGVETANFVGNKAYAWSFTCPEEDRKLGDKKDYALGGAIYSGIIGITGAERHLAGDIITSIGVIGHIDDDGKPSVIFSDNVAHTYNTMLGISTTNMSHSAYGGAIYNGIEKISDSSKDTSIAASIMQIIADFSGNHALNETRQNGVYHALGGAVYNGINDSHVTGSNVEFSSTIEQGIFGSFEKNCAINSATAQKGEYHAFGGAIYNGLTNVSPGEESVSFIASIGDIGSEEYKSTFDGNYATNSSAVTALGEYLASGGAIYNGIGTIANQTAPQTIYTSIGDIAADFTGNYAGIGDSSANQVTQKALGGAIYNRIGSIDGRGEEIKNRLQEDGTAYIYTDACRWQEGASSANDRFSNKYQDTGKYTNHGKFVSDLNATLADPKFEETGLPSGAIPSAQLDTDEWDKFAKSIFVHGKILGAHGISTQIGNITGVFKENRAVAREYASGGALESGIDGITGSSSEITNTAELRVENSAAIADEDSFSKNKSKPKEDIRVELVRDLQGKYTAPVEFKNSITNSGGDISVIFGDINGTFTANGAFAIEANGGAISNGLNEFSAGSIETENTLIAAHYYNPKITTKGSSLVLNDTIKTTFLLDNKFTAEIANIEGGTIGAFMESIAGEFSDNRAMASEIAKGGAVYNRLSSIAGGSGTLTNTNGTSIYETTQYGTDATMYYDSIIRTGSTDTSITYSDDLTAGHLIDNDISVFFNNGNGDTAGGFVSVKIGDISAIFSKNYAEGKVALGGAIYNGIEKLSGGAGEIYNTNNILYYYNSTAVWEDSAELIFDGKNDITYRISNEYKAGISNIGGEIKSTIGEITGNFEGNHVGKATTTIKANGGAISNSLGELSAGSIKLHNVNSISYLFDKTESSIAAEVTEKTDFSGEDYNTAEIVNNIDVSINNRQGIIQTEIESIDGSFKKNEAKGESAKGGAIFNSIEKLSAALIQISNVRDESYYACDSTSKKAKTTPDDRIKDKKDGLIFNTASIKNNIKAGFDNSNDGIIEAAIETISGEIFENNKAEGSTEANGGAIYNGMDELLGATITYEAGEDLSTDSIEASFNNSNGGKIQVSIGNISSDFKGNYATSENGKAKGGAIYNGIGSIGDHVEIDNSHGGVLAAMIGPLSGQFNENRAESTHGDALGGAIYNGIGAIGVEVQIDNSDGGITAAHIEKITSDFTKNYATSENGKAYGGAIYNGVESGAAEGVNAIIGDITGAFTDNSAVSAVGDETLGGAIYNSGSIGRISDSTFTTNGFVAGDSMVTSGGAIYNDGTGSITSIDATKFAGNRAEMLGSALTNIGSIGEIAADATSTPDGREYDNSLIGGIVNTSFTGNSTAAADAERAAALYTETSLAIIARDSSKVLFEENTVGSEGLTRDIYVAANADSEMPDIYMVAEQGSSITTHGEINGAAGYTLRLRGFTERKADTLSTHASGGVVDFEGLVMKADIIMDDVTLKLGLAKDATKDYVKVHDDANTRRKDGHELHPDEIDFSGNGGVVSGETASFDREYSDVLRSSRLEARSGRVQPGDTGVANYNIGTIISYGRMSYDNAVENGGYYTTTEDKLFATWAVNLDLSAQKATTYTTWVREGDPAASSRGYITLSSLNINGALAGDPVTTPEGVESTYDYPYIDVTVQIINLIRQDATGAVTDTPTAWTQEGDINSSVPLQLDLGEFSQKKEAAAYMSSRDILCDGIDYGTTKTWHDSLRIWGWRDNLAAWAELQLKEKSLNDSENEKEFYIIDTHTLTRNLRRVDGRLLQQDTLKLYGDGIGASTLNVNEKNLLKEIAPGQSVELKDMSIIRVGQNSILNEGRLIMDTLKVEPELTVHNESELIKRGVWDIENTFTSDTPKTNSMVFDHATTTIYGTIEHQNIYHESESVTKLVANAEADKRETVWSGAETAAFRAFQDNALTMNSGTFYLSNLNSSELHLRDLSISGGSIVVNSVTVDLSQKHMGMIWSDDSTRATYDPAKGGHIRVENVVLLPKDGKESSMRIPVQFVNPEVGESVVPFGEDNDYGTPNAADNGHTVSKTRENQFGQVFVYNVHYDYTTGQYIYERVVKNTPGDNTPGGDTPGGDTPGGNTPGGDPVVNPNVQASPAATLAGGIASLMQVNDYVFEHADLFSAHVYNTQKARLRERSFTIVTPTKGKNAVAKAPAPKASCSYLAGFKGGMWVRPYAGYEKLPLSGGPKVTNSLYGALVGGDTELKEHKNGWSSVFSAHAAYMGSTQRYTERGAGVRISQNGGGVGLTGTFYYKNFYTALTGTVATSGGHASGSQGTENFRTVMGGVASRSGYNIEFGKGRYVLQPTLLASFTSIHMPDYTNAAGAHITANPLNVLQLHPYVKFIMNTDSCWEPYFTLGYVHNLTGKTSYRANGIKLPEMSIDPYVEYSLGVQKTWADKYTIFGQATGRNGGRNGVEFSAGLRCTW